VSAAVIILAHEDPDQVRRLIGALSGLDVFLHCDVRTPVHVYAAMTEGAPEQVRLLPRRRAERGGWSLVDVELRALRAALDATAAEHLVVASGSCYPLVSVDELLDDLARWRGLSRFTLFPLPYPGWDVPRWRDGGYRRLRWRHLTFKGGCVRLGNLPVPLYRRKLPAGLEAYGVSAWRIYSREHAAKLLEVLDSRPDLVRFFRTSLVPEEHCPASILRSPALVGSVAEAVRHDHPWHIAWPDPTSGASARHPRFLTLDDLPALRQLQALPCHAPTEVNGHPESHRRLFARKLRSLEGELLDAIDEELRR
jgi:hypothetical protein